MLPAQKDDTLRFNATALNSSFRWNFAVDGLFCCEQKYSISCKQIFEVDEKTLSGFAHSFTLDDSNMNVIFFSLSWCTIREEGTRAMADCATAKRCLHFLLLRMRHTHRFSLPPKGGRCNTIVWRCMTWHDVTNVCDLWHHLLMMVSLSHPPRRESVAADSSIFCFIRHIRLSPE